MRKINATQVIDHMKRAIDDLSAFTGRCVAEALAATRKAEALVHEGRTGEAERFSASEQARLQLACTDAGARFEAATVRFLGERRSASEHLADYTGRIAWTMQDLSRVLEMQRRNGLEMNL